MTIVRLNPLSVTALGDMETLHHQMNRLLAGLADGLPNDLGTDLGFSSSLKERGLDGYVPKAELIETNEALVLNLELPGINPDELTIEVTAESVSVKGERKANAESPSKGENSKGDKRLNRSEFRYGSFHRVMTLPIQIQQTNVEANYRNGILSLTLPKVVEEKDKVVKVTVH